MRIPAVLIVVATALLPSACYSSRDPGGVAGGGPATLAGAPAQSFTVPDAAGRGDSLAAHRGQVLLVNLWASWCPPCRDEIPALERFARSEGGRVTVLGIDEGESRDVAAAFARAHGVTYPILIDEQQQYGRTYAAVGLPTTIVVGRDGRIVRGIDGPLTLAQMHAAVAPALAAR